MVYIVHGVISLPWAVIPAFETLGPKINFVQTNSLLERSTANGLGAMVSRNKFRVVRCSTRHLARWVEEEHSRGDSLLQPVKNEETYFFEKTQEDSNQISVLDIRIASSANKPALGSS
jgi:hypothetical protein